MKKTIIFALLVIGTFFVFPTKSNTMFIDRVTYDEEEKLCLAKNIYYEARGSILADQAAVSDVVLNRVKDPRYPNTICGVVTQGKKHSNGNMILHKCQFSWYCDGKSDEPKNALLWQKSKALAKMILDDYRFRGISQGATHYHAHYVNPKWADELQKVGRIGVHRYYKWN